MKGYLCHNLGVLVELDVEGTFLPCWAVMFHSKDRFLCLEKFLFDFVVQEADRYLGEEKR